VSELQAGAAPRIAEVAREEAATVLSPDRLGAELYSMLLEVAGVAERTEAVSAELAAARG
jgi:hypothetical protein